MLYILRRGGGGSGGVGGVGGHGGGGGIDTGFVLKYPLL